MKRLLLFIFLIAYSCSKASAYFITVDSHTEECFFDKVEFGTKMGKNKFRITFAI